MSFDPDSGLHRTPLDHDLEPRRELLESLHLGNEPVPELDEIAESLARAAGQPYAMVNLITDQQFFAGMYISPGSEDVGRTMSRDHGYCPDVLHRPGALILPDVCAYPRFQSNHVVDALGVRTYSGAPLIHHDSGITLGTVCFIGPDRLPQETGRTSQALIKDHRDRAMEAILARPARLSD